MEKKGQARPGRAVRGLTLLIGIFAIAAAAIFVKENKPASVGEAIAMLKFGNYQLTFENIQQLDLAEIASEGSAQLVGVAVPADIIRQVLPTTEHKVVLGRLVSHGDVMGIYNYPYYLLLTTASVPETERFVIRHGKTHGYILVDHSGGVRFEPYRVRDPNWSSPNPVDYALAVEVMQWDEEWKAGGSRSTARELYSRTQQD
ncbi:MAG TPA: hypothetical protein VJZ71_18690 [Phycisphaerae bacterium]|nr:hypothetical protein [Phycisphaerae bacterium]